MVFFVFGFFSRGFCLWNKAQIIDRELKQNTNVFSKNLKSLSHVESSILTLSQKWLYHYYTIRILN